MRGTGRATSALVSTTGCTAERRAPYAARPSSPSRRKSGPPPHRGAEAAARAASEQILDQIILAGARDGGPDFDLIDVYLQATDELTLDHRLGHRLQRYA